MINPIIFKIGSLEIRWYGLIMALAFLIGSLIAVKLGKKRNLNKDQVYDFLIYLIPFSILFARLFHVFVYNFSYYTSNPIQIFQIWKGGVSLFGGLFGALIAAIIYSKVKKVPLLNLADVFIIPLSFGIIFGRIGNFINQELYGKITNLPWAMKFDNVEGLRHPTQIYEALGHLIIFLVLIFIWKKSPRKGVIFYIFLILYSTFRFFMEFLREGDILIFKLTTTQLIIVPIILISFFLLLRLKKENLLNTVI
ncbi:prolipoprotein diacylglyceryl transferase [Candidatus Woesearchaeota archaeon]|nr:prolipoprotein diacylglyceryl transferase [Candidatus Woesearchaeota archaeon]